MTTTGTGPWDGPGPGSSGEADPEPIADGGTPTPYPLGDPGETPGETPVEAVVRRRRVEGRQRRITRLQAGLTLVFVVLLAGLAYLGYRTSLRIGGGSSDRITDPEAPGYLAEPRPTPVDLFVVTAEDGSFSSALLVAPDGSGEGGTAVPLPPSLVLPEYQGAPPVFLSDLYAESGLEGVQERLGIALGFRIASAEQVPASTLALLAGGEPIVIDNVDNLVQREADGSETLAYSAGELTLQPGELPGFLGFQGADDPAPNQALREQLVWEQLFGRAAGADLAGLPEGERSEGSQSPGFGQSLEALLAGETTFDLLPMDEVPVPDSYLVAWMPDAAALDLFAADLVPLPESPVPGARVATAVLDGTGPGGELVGSVVPVVVRNGGEVVLVGNADSFEVATTSVEYSTPEAAEVAGRMAAELGVSAVEATEALEGAPVVVVIGADRAG